MSKRILQGAKRFSKGELEQLVLKINFSNIWSFSLGFWALATFGLHVVRHLQLELGEETRPHLQNQFWFFASAVFNKTDRV